MNRHYSFAEYRKFVEKARELIPDIHIGTDVIAGFPGETERDFEECLNFTEKIQFANTHIFTYSRRPGTPAADYPEQIPAKTASARSAALRSAAKRSTVNFAKSQIGKELDVIFEQCRNGQLSGWSDNYLGIIAPQGSFPTGKIVRVTATGENLAILKGISIE